MHNPNRDDVNDNNENSINSLILALCRSMVGDELNSNKVFISKLKSKSFEILLKKFPQSRYEEDGNNFDSFHELKAHIFAAKLSSRNNSLEHEKIKDFEMQLEQLENDEYIASDAGKSIIKLLLSLQNNKTEAQPITKQTTLLIPAPFTLHASYENNKYYPNYTLNCIVNPKPRFFKGIEELSSNENPYMPKCVETKCNKLELIEFKYSATCTIAEPKKSELCNFTNMTRRLCGIKVPTLRELFKCQNLPKLESTSEIVNKELTLINHKVEAAPPPKKDEERLLSWNWEHYGCIGVKQEKPFISEANMLLDLKCMQHEEQGGKFIAKIVPFEQFIKDLKSLCVGIQSDIFKHNELCVFEMETDITTAGLLPETVQNYVHMFLECGTCYKRLQGISIKRYGKLLHEGFLFKALCNALDEYLITFRQNVFQQDDKYLLSFQRRMHTTIKQIVYLTHTLLLTPNDININPPVGAQLLCFLYNEVTRLTDKRLISIFVFFIKRLCHSYFKHLEKWTFFGILDDTFNELFIYHINHYKHYTKYFYDKAYCINKNNIPGFLQKYDEHILLCGKYTMLLKSYKPNHPLLKLKSPSLSVCLSYEEIENLQVNCKKYYDAAREVCGKPITVKDVFAQRTERKNQFYEIAAQRAREHINKWLEEQHALALLAAAEKRKTCKELTQQMEYVRQRKIDDRRKNIEFERQVLEEAKKIEDKRLAEENIVLQRRVAYYKELQEICNAKYEAKLKNNMRKHNKQMLNENVQKLTYSNPDINDACADNTVTLKRSISDYINVNEISDVSKDFEKNRQKALSGAVMEQCIVQMSTKQKPIHSESLEVDKNSIKTKVLLESETTSKDEQNNENAKSTATIIGAPTLTRSVSDVINSNVLQEVEKSSLEKNRQNIMNSRILVQNTEILPITAPVTHMNVEMQNELTSAKTEAKRNKLKVLSQEFGSLPNESQLKVPDINLNTLPDSELTDLQRNRKRMMQNDLFSEYNKDPLAERAKLNLNLCTDLARNRRKVLQNEFHILSEEITMPKGELLTPMSTTSDTPITENAPNCVIQTIQKTDEENGNLTQLKINVDLAKQPSDTEHFCLTTNAQTTTTPVSALNTAGVLARHGFSFPNDLTLKNQQDNTDTGTQIINKNGTETNTLLPHDYENPYKLCFELMQNNFTNVPNSKHFLLAKPTKDKVKEITADSLDVITLTNFLQKSVTIPIQIYHGIINNEIMRMLLVDVQLLEHIRSLRHYYLLMDGEFGLKICHGIISKLEEGAKPEQLLNFQSLHMILDNALASSFSGHYKNSENLSFTIGDVPEKFDLLSPDVLHNLSLSYNVSWPLNLVLSPHTLEQYGHIFKFLLKVRRISWVYEDCYRILKHPLAKHGKQILKSPQYQHIQSIRHKFLNFIHTLKHHITANALQASWKTFKDELEQCNSMEEIYRVHTSYVKRIMFLCMLNRSSAEFLNSIENIFKILLRFYYNLKACEFKCCDDDVHFTHPRYDKLVNNELEFEKFIKYTVYLGNKIVRRGYQEEIGEFINLINFNNYYTTPDEK